MCPRRTWTARLVLSRLMGDFSKGLGLVWSERAVTVGRADVAADPALMAVVLGRRRMGILEVDRICEEGIISMVS